VLTPTEDVATRLSEFEPWLSKIGARVVIMSPEQHDKVVAATSHLPQLLSTALSVTLAQQDLPRLLEVFGPGLLDMTRLSLSSPDIWRSILQTNREEIADALKRLSFTLQRMTAELEGGQELEQLFATGQKFATDLRSL
jgi:prephenate dehydrogenase